MPVGRPLTKSRTRQAELAEKKAAKDKAAAGGDQGCFSFFSCFGLGASNQPAKGQQASSVLSYYGKPKGNTSSGQPKEHKTMLKNSKPYKSPEWLKNA